VPTLAGVGFDVKRPNPLVQQLQIYSQILSLRMVFLTLFKHPLSHFCA
jgi:hypothetical protein